MGNLDHPDWMLLDLDPVDTSFDQIIEAALLVREILSGLGLNGYPKTTGGDGMHVYVPFEAIYSYDQIRSFRRDRFALWRSIANRTSLPLRGAWRSGQKGRVYFDYLQIGISKTIAAPYVVRAYDGAPVATPLDWKEVKHGLRPEDFRIDNAIARFERVGDLFAPVLEGGQRLEDALERVQDADKQQPGADTVEKPKPKRARKSG